MIAQELSAYPRLLRKVRDATAERASLNARVKALLPAEHRHLADDLEDAAMGEQMDIHRLLVMGIGAHLGVPWGTMAHLLSHVCEECTGPDYEWRDCDCMEYEAGDTASEPEGH